MHPFQGCSSMNADKYIQVCNHLQNQDTEHFRHHKLFVPLDPFVISSLSASSASVSH